MSKLLSINYSSLRGVMLVVAVQVVAVPLFEALALAPLALDRTVIQLLVADRLIASAIIYQTDNKDAETLLLPLLQWVVGLVTSKHKPNKFSHKRVKSGVGYLPKRVYSGKRRRNRYRRLLKSIGLLVPLVVVVVAPRGLEQGSRGGCNSRLGTLMRLLCHPKVRLEMMTKDLGMVLVALRLPLVGEGERTWKNRRCGSLNDLIVSERRSANAQESESENLLLLRPHLHQ
jgi:hypothetical protein